MKRVLLKLTMVAFFAFGSAMALTVLPLFLSRWNSKNIGMSPGDIVFGLIPVAYVVIGSVLGTSAVAFPAARVMGSESLFYSVMWAAIVGLCSSMSYLTGMNSAVAWLVLGSWVHLGALLPSGVAIIAGSVVSLELVLHLLIRSRSNKSTQP